MISTTSIDQVAAALSGRTPGIGNRDPLAVALAAALCCLGAGCSATCPTGATGPSGPAGGGLPGDPGTLLYGQLVTDGEGNPSVIRATGVASLTDGAPLPGPTATLRITTTAAVTLLDSLNLLGGTLALGGQSSFPGGFGANIAFGTIRQAPGVYDVYAQNEATGALIDIITAVQSVGPVTIWAGRTDGNSIPKTLP